MQTKERLQFAHATDAESSCVTRCRRLQVSTENMDIPCKRCTLDSTAVHFSKICTALKTGSWME
jgi:hypothetical protein